MIQSHVLFEDSRNVGANRNMTVFGLLDLLVIRVTTEWHRQAGTAAKLGYCIRRPRQN